MTTTQTIGDDKKAPAGTANGVNAGVEEPVRLDDATANTGTNGICSNSNGTTTLPPLQPRINQIVDQYQRQQQQQQASRW